VGPAWQRKKGREERAGARARGWHQQAGPRWQREREEGVRGVAGLRKRNGPAVAHAGEGEEKGPKEKKKRIWADGLLGCFSLLLFFSFFFPILN
jgi:hypothetical protein